MKVIESGHQYELASLDGGEPITLTFVKRAGVGYPGNVGAHPGTTIQETVRALLDRCRYVNAQVACLETQMCIRLLQSVLGLLEMRAKRVKGKEFGSATLDSIEMSPTCERCGHVSCSENHDR